VSDVEIDWPNDLLFCGRKLGGILAEMRSAGGSARDLVIGLGLNVHHGETDFPAELLPQATSLRMAAGRGILEMESIAAGYLDRLADIGSRLEHGEWSDIAGRWERLAPGCRGRRIRLVNNGFEGLTCGIDDEGGLVVRNDEGVTTVVRMADVVAPLEV
jgi:BirA family biotin operon repressor/biotin-[acetyl-CoA-carboxylase] ligase